MPLRPTSVGAFLALPLLFACNDLASGPTYVTSADSVELSHYAVAHQALLLSELGELNSQFPSVAGLSAPATALQRGHAAQRYIRGLLATLAVGDNAVPAATVARITSAPFSECVPTITGVDSAGDAIDTDDDGIPDDYKIDFGSACVSADSAGTTRITQSGSLRIQDTDLGFFSFRVTLDHESTKTENLTTGQVDAIGTDGFEAAEFGSAGANRTLSLAVATSVLADGVTENEAQYVTRMADFLPDTGKTLSLGNDLPAGTLHFAADVQEVNGFEGKNFSFLVRTTTDLHFDPACAHQFDAGTLHGELGRVAGTGFDVTWAGCTTPAVTIFGNTEP